MSDRDELARIIHNAQCEYENCTDISESYPAAVAILAAGWTAPDPDFERAYTDTGASE